jgi:hypothetical protein
MVSTNGFLINKNEYMNKPQEIRFGRNIMSYVVQFSKEK